MLSKKLLLFQFLGLFFMASCKFNVSPYSADVPKLLLNEVNMKRIVEIEAQTGPDFKIAFISDTHNYYSELDRMIDSINANGPYDFIIVAGDITNLGHL